MGVHTIYTKITPEVYTPFTPQKAFEVRSFRCIYEGKKGVPIMQISWEGNPKYTYTPNTPILHPKVDVLVVYFLHPPGVMG